MADVGPMDIKTLIQRVVETTCCTVAQAELALHDNDNNANEAVNQILEQPNPAYECWTELKSRKKKEGEKLYRGGQRGGRGAFIRGSGGRVEGRGGSTSHQFRDGPARGGATRGHHEETTNERLPAQLQKLKEGVAKSSSTKEIKEATVKSEISKENIHTEIVKTASPTQSIASSAPMTPVLCAELRVSSKASSIASSTVCTDPTYFAETVIVGSKTAPSPTKVQPQPVKTIKPPQEKISEPAPAEVVSKGKNATDYFETKEVTLESRILMIASPPRKVEQVEVQRQQTKSPKILPKANETSQLKNDLVINSKPIKAGQSPHNNKTKALKTYKHGNVEFLYDPRPISTEYSFGYMALQALAAVRHGFSSGDNKADAKSSKSAKVKKEVEENLLPPLPYEQMYRNQAYQQYIDSNYNVARAVQPPIGFAQNIYGIQTQSYPAPYEAPNYNQYMFQHPAEIRVNNTQEYVGGHYAEKIIQPPPGFPNCHTMLGNIGTYVPQYEYNTYNQYNMQQSAVNVSAIPVHPFYPQQEEVKTTSGAILNNTQEYTGTHFINSSSNKRMDQLVWSKTPNLFY